MKSLRGKFLFIGMDIGNEGDISPRVMESLKESDLVYCEHSQRGKQLAVKYQLRAKIIHLAAEEEVKKIPQILKQLEEGMIVSYLSDAGLPGIQDPGKRLLLALKEGDWDYELIPGPSAVAMALFYTNFPGPYLVKGFWNKKEKWLDLKRDYEKAGLSTVVYFLSCHDLEDFSRWWNLQGSPPVEVMKDMTKNDFQWLGTWDTFLQVVGDLKQAKGEYMIAIHSHSSAHKKKDEGFSEEEEKNLEEIYRCLPEHLSHRDCSLILKNITGLPKRQVYEWLQKNSRN